MFLFCEAENLMKMNNLCCSVKWTNCYRPHPKDGEGNVFSLSTPRGEYPHPIMRCNIIQNAMEQTPSGGTLPGPGGGVTQPGGWGYPAGGTLPMGYPAQGVPCWGYPARGVPSQGIACPGGTLPGGYPVRTTEGVLTTRRAVCLLRSRRRTFLFTFLFQLQVYQHSLVLF